MRTWRVVGVLALALAGGCGAKQSGATDPPAPGEPPGADAGKAACCDPAQNPGGIEGAHCCADGSWRGDIGNGGSEECAPLGGDGQVCKTP